MFSVGGVESLELHHINLPYLNALPGAPSVLQDKKMDSAVAVK